MPFLSDEDRRISVYEFEFQSHSVFELQLATFQAKSAMETANAAAFCGEQILPVVAHFFAPYSKCAKYEVLG
jgi:hypothetical protein